MTFHKTSMLPFLILGTLFTLKSFSQTLSLEKFTASEIENPVEFTRAGDDRFFVVNQIGKISVVKNDGTVLTTPFLDITDRVPLKNSQDGLLGLAFHPDYATNGKFYIYYIAAGYLGTLSEFSVSSDPNVADLTSEIKLMEFDSNDADHKGGCLQFGPDAKLYLTVGDGGKSTWGKNAQNRTNYMGKLLRISVPGDGTYAIPSDNPYAEHATFKKEIWAYGLRNPWKFRFDSESGDLYIGEVGGDVWDEINYQPAGAEGGQNYGWPCYEANDLFDNPDPAFYFANCPDISTLTFPIMTYYQATPAIKVTVIGGQVYRGTKSPWFKGWYIYGESYSGELFGMRQKNEEWEQTSFGSEKLFWVAFTQGMDGELYGLTLKIPGLRNTGNNIYKLTLTAPSSTSETEIHVADKVVVSNSPEGHLVVKGLMANDRIEVFSITGQRMAIQDKISSDEMVLTDLYKGIYLLVIKNSHRTSDVIKKLIQN